MTCYNEKCNYFSWEYVGNPGRVPACNKNKVLEAFDCSTCGFNPDKEKTIITEEDHLEEVWFKQAKEQTLETLPDFINHVMNDYYHDYGTVCHAISACAIAAAYAANDSDSGGVTGFQAGFIMWDFIHQWMYGSNKCGMKIVDYDDMLYPQCKFKYEKTISSSTWRSIQKEAKKNLDDYRSGADAFVAQPVLDHWQSIVDGKIPFGYTISDD